MSRTPSSFAMFLLAGVTLAAAAPGDDSAGGGSAELKVIKGFILDPAKMPVPGARVTATAEGGFAGTPVRSAADGSFSVPARPGRYELRVVIDGFKPANYAVDLRMKEPAPEPLEIVLEVDESRQMVTVVESASGPPAVSSSLKAPVLLLNVPQAVTMVTANQIRDQGMQNMADVVRYIPGITMAQGEGHRDAPVIRGNATTADFFVNGVRDDVQYFRDLYNVERVEAVKGANALTFGRGGGGGVINRVTKQADVGASPLREMSLQGGMFGNRRASADFGRSFWRERAAARLNTLYEDSNSFRHGVNVERYGVAPSMTVRAGDRTLVRASYEYFHDGRTVDRGIPSFNGAPALAAHRSAFFGDPDASFATAGVHLGSAAVEHQMASWVLRNTTLVGDYGKFYQNVFPGAVNAAMSLVSISGYNNRTDRRNLFNQTDVSGTAATGRIRHTILAGTELGRQRTGNFRNTAYFGGGGAAAAASVSLPFESPSGALGALFRQAATDADNGATNRVAAAFLQDQLELTRHVQLVAGLRYDYFDTNFVDHRSASIGTPPQLRRADHLVAPRLGLVVKPVNSVSLYGSYSVTFLPSSGDQFASLSATTQTLRPERFNNYEVGAKMELHRRLSLTTALYRLDRNNSTARDPNNPSRIVQTGSQRTNGFEAGINGALTSRWQIAGGYAAQDAFVARATTAAALGANVALVPRHSFSLWNHYRILPRWSMGLGTIRQASMFAGIDNAVRLPGFTRADVAGFFSVTERVKLQANLENLFDSTYYPTAHSNTNILPGAPRTLRLTLVARF